MASVRPIPVSYYYSGQGRLGIGDRDPTTGEYSNLIFVGNVTSLTIDIATTKFDHKESMSGQRAIDLSIVQEKNATFTMNAESLILDLLSLGLYGTNSVISAGVVAAEIHKVVKGQAIPLKHPNVTGVIVAPEGGGSAYVEGTDYQVDEGFGTIYTLASGGMVDGGNVTVNYNHGAFDQIDAFTQFTAPERYLRFEGLNTVDGSLRLIEIPRASFDPLTGMEMINEELGSGEFNGSVLPDLTIIQTGASQYFRERRVGGAGSSIIVPTIAAAVIANADPDSLVLTASQALTSPNPTGAGGFTVATTGAAVTVSSVTVAGSTVTLALSRAIAAGETVSLSYAPPVSNPLANTYGTVSAFSGKSVTNNVA
jgi:uncharacterized repeat protein (TIGR02059 family)